MNEALLLLSVVIIYGAVLLAYRLFGREGLFGFTAIATILANIEVLILVDAFGMEQTLGNVMFASTYLVTDILSENEGERDAKTAVYIGIFASIAMLVFTGGWLLFTPSAGDTVMPAIVTIFSKTPRLMLASIVGYAVSQRIDVRLYHFWWRITTRLGGGEDRRRFLWVRNNGSTLISQIINTVLFTTIAFFGMYPTDVFLSIMLSSYLIYIVTSVLDTPAAYLARRIGEKRRSGARS